MTYNSAIPVNTNFMANSEKQIRSNYQTIKAVFARNHVALNSDTPGNSQGMHNVLTFRAQSNIPGQEPPTAADQIALYTKLVSSVPMLFYRPSNNQADIQLTYPSISTGLQTPTPPVYLATQYSYMAGPFVFYFGILSVPNGTVITLTTTPSLPITNLIYVGLTSADIGFNSKSACPTSIAANQFTVSYAVTSINMPVFYMAIGV